MQRVELSAEGLLLRGWQPEDADAVYRACQDPEIQRWTLVPVPYLRRNAAEFVGERCASAWERSVAAPLGVFDQETGELLGANGLVRLDLVAGVGELGTWVAPWARGRRVAQRATRAVARWGFDVLRLRLLVWQAEVGNHASRLVAERVGFTFDGPARAGMHDRDGAPVDGWRGTLCPGEVRAAPAAWFAPGGPGARRAAVFGAPQPRLAAGRVTLRPLVDHDADRIQLTCSDPETVRWTDIPVPYGAADALAAVRTRAPGLWRRGEAASFGIADADDGYLGSIDLRISDEDPGTAAVSFMIAPQARGRGTATDAVRALCAWGFEALGLTRIVWRAYVGNEASRRVAQRAGFTMEGVQRSGCTQRGERRDAWVAALLAA